MQRDSTKVRVEGNRRDEGGREILHKCQSRKVSRSNSRAITVDGRRCPRSCRLLTCALLNAGNYLPAQTALARPHCCAYLRIILLNCLQWRVAWQRKRADTCSINTESWPQMRSRNSQRVL